MRVLLVRNAFKLGGAELYYVSLTEALTKHGAQCFMVTGQPELRAILKSNGRRVLRVPWSRNGGRSKLVYAPFAIFAYLYIILRYRIQILNVSGRDDQIFATAAAKLLGRKVLWTDHGDLKHVWLNINPWHTKMIRWAIKRADKVIFVCQEDRDVTARNCPGLEQRFLVVNNGVPAKLFQQERKVSEPPVVFTNIRVQEAKGFLDLVEASGLLAAQGRAFRLVSAGGVEDEALLAEAREKLGERFKYLGFLKANEVAEQLAACSVYAFPSHTEAFPLSVIEAMHAGATIVATRVGGIPEQITDGETGLLVPAKNPGELGGAIGRLLDDGRLAGKLGVAARAEAAAKYDLDRIVERQMMPVYNALVAS